VSENELTETPDLKVVIQDKYWAHLMEHGKAPHSIYLFCQELEITERAFYDHYSSFEAITSGFWAWLITDTQATLEADEDYQGYDTRGKLLAFLYTFFETALGYRSRFLVAFPRREKALFCPSVREMKSAFDLSAQSLMEEVVAEGSALVPAQLQQQSYRGGWPVLLMLIEFWLQDTSKGFQDTDSLIEKTVKFGHEVTRFSAVDAAVDLGRFLLGRYK